MKNGRDLGKAFDLPADFERIGLKPQVCGKAFWVKCNFDYCEFPAEGFTPIGNIDPKDSLQGMVTSTGKRPPLCMILEVLV